MPRLPLPSTIEHGFLVNTLTEQSLRVDGRKPLDARKLEVKFGSSYGSVEVILGGTTRVSVQVSADIVKPRDERPFEGFVVLQTEISPVAGSNYETGAR
jgi:exosome complex component RRP45